MQESDKLEKRTIERGSSPQDRRETDCSRTSESFFGKGGGWVAAQFLVMTSWVALTPKREQADRFDSGTCGRSNRGRFFPARSCWERASVHSQSSRLTLSSFGAEPIPWCVTRFMPA